MLQIIRLPVGRQANTANIIMRIKNLRMFVDLHYNNNPTISNATMFSILIIGLIAGPAVSL